MRAVAFEFTVLSHCLWRSLESGVFHKHRVHIFFVQGPAARAAVLRTVLVLQYISTAVTPAPCAVS